MDSCVSGRAEKEKSWKGVIRELGSTPRKGIGENEGKHFKKRKCSMISHVTESSSKLRTKSCALDLRIRKWLVNRKGNFNHSRNYHEKNAYLHKAYCIFQTFFPVSFERTQGCGRESTMQQRIWGLGASSGSPASYWLYQDQGSAVRILLLGSFHFFSCSKICHEWIPFRPFKP